MRKFLNDTTQNISFKQFVQSWLISQKFWKFWQNTKTQYSQHIYHKNDTSVHTPKPKLDIVLNVDKFKNMDKEFIGVEIRAQTY